MLWGNIDMYYISTCSTPLGPVLLASDGNKLCGLWFEGQKHFMYGIDAAASERKDLDIFKVTEVWLERYFNGEKPLPSELPLSPRGSEFAREIWTMLLAIPYGMLVSYGNLAALYAKKHGLDSMSAQAVGGAVGRNPISIIIPCHRVVASNGSLTGYAGGLDRKIGLLTHEGIEPERAGNYRFML